MSFHATLTIQRTDSLCLDSTCSFWRVSCNRLKVCLQMCVVVSPGVSSGVAMCVFSYRQVCLLVSPCVSSGIAMCVFWYRQVSLLVSPGVSSGIARCVFWYRHVCLLVSPGVSSGIARCVFWYRQVCLCLEVVSRLRHQGYCSCVLINEEMPPRQNP